MEYMRAIFSTHRIAILDMIRIFLRIADLLLPLLQQHNRVRFDVYSQKMSSQPPAG